MVKQMAVGLRSMMLMEAVLSSEVGWRVWYFSNLCVGHVQGIGRNQRQRFDNSVSGLLWCTPLLVISCEIVLCELYTAQAVAEGNGPITQYFGFRAQRRMEVQSRTHCNNLESGKHLLHTSTDHCLFEIRDNVRAIANLHFQLHNNSGRPWPVQTPIGVMRICIQACYMPVTRCTP